jgi:glycosyltransferase involved in cell wall biosynthesis
VVFHGFVDDHRDVESILADATVAVAPYVVDDTNFSRYADPGKLKAYLGAGLPIVLTAVPPNAAAIAEAGAGRVVEDSPAALARGIEELMASEEGWLAASRAATTYAEAFDWNLIFARTLGSLGFE